MRPLESSAPIHSVEEWVIAVMALVMAIGNVVLGWLLILGDPERMTGPTFQTIEDIASGWVWGTAFLVAGLLALVGQIWRLTMPARLGHGFAAVACLIFAIAFAYGGSLNGQASLTGVAAYGTLAAIHAIITKVSPPRAGLYGN